MFNSSGQMAYPQAFDKAGKACQEQTVLLIGPICKLQKSFSAPDSSLLDSYL